MTLYLWSVLLVSPAEAAPPMPELPDLEQVFDLLDATPAQRQALRDVAVAAARDLGTDGARREALQLVGETVSALMAQDVDRDALEATRRDAVDLLDRTSSKLLPHAADAVEILTPAQRARVRDLVRAEAERWLAGSGA